MKSDWWMILKWQKIADGSSATNLWCQRPVWIHARDCRFEAEFCNRVLQKRGRVETNVQGRQRHIWREAAEKRWRSVAVSVHRIFVSSCKDSIPQAARLAWGSRQGD
jgi:hypothetical protein